MNSGRYFARHISTFLGEHRLGYKLITAIMIASTCMALIATAVQLYFEYRRDLSQIESEFVQIEQSHLPVLSNSFWALDVTQIKLQLEGLLQLQDVQYVEITGKMGEHFEAGYRPDSKALTRHFALRHKSAPEQVQGMLSVSVSLESVYQRLINSALVILVTQAAKTFFIVLFLLFIVNRWVTGPLTHMARFARSLSLDRLGAPLVLSRKPQRIPDELDHVVTALNDMSSTLAAELARRNEMEAERARLFEELKQHRDHLEELVRDRTENLRIAKERAEIASNAKSAFLTSMSHELRTPLNAILGYAQVLKRESDLSERQRNGLSTIHSSGQHLLTLINDLLDLAKIEAGKVDLYEDAVNLDAFLELIVDIIRVRADQKHIQFISDVSRPLPTVLADEKRLRQILLNLLGNAVKFTDHGQVSLRVRLIENDGQTTRLRFEVEDTGVGISPEQLEHIFIPFEQVGDVRRRASGTGLGLAISRQLTHLMGGNIEVDSRQDEGSRFWFELSLQVVQQAVTATRSVEPMVTGYTGARRKVLVVDDQIANLHMLEALLSGIGFGTCCAVNGREAVEKAQAERPDLVVTDLVMPEMDGLEATRRIRQTPGLESLPIIMASASAMADDEELSIKAGANLFIAKPIDVENLLRQIRLLLGVTWIYAQPEPVAPTGQSAPDAPLILPPREQMRHLHELALLGNMRDIRRQAEHIASLDEQYRPLSDKIDELARSYQSKAILSLVEELMSEQAHES